MLEDYKESQEIAYNIMMQEIESNHIGHAYLIDENNNDESFNIVLSFVKEIITMGLSETDKQLILKRIDDNNYPELKIIEPDGMLIKKQQVLDLQLEFSKSAVEGKKRIYIIKDADKMRSETANSMLKFLEEPVNNVVAILMTNNFNNLLSTIISRCQVIRLGNNMASKFDTEIDELVVNFITNVEKKGFGSIIDEQQLLFNIIPVKERNKYMNFFDKTIDMYYDIMKINIGFSEIKYMQYFDIFKQIAIKNTKMQLLKKINYLIESKEKIKNNVNINLLIDSIIVKIGGENEGSWC